MYLPPILIPNSQNQDLGFGELGVEITLLMNVRFPNDSLVYHRNLPSYSYMVCVLLLLYCAGVAMNGLIKRTSPSSFPSTGKHQKKKSCSQNNISLRIKETQIMKGERQAFAFC